MPKKTQKTIGDLNKICLFLKIVDKGTLQLAKLQSYQYTDYLAVINVLCLPINNRISLRINNLDGLCKFAIAK